MLEETSNRKIFELPHDACVAPPDDDKEDKDAQEEKEDDTNKENDNTTETMKQEPLEAEQVPPPKTVTGLDSGLELKVERHLLILN